MSDHIYRVLLIEDDPMVQEVNRQFIERVEGFKVVGTATNGVQGIEMIRELHPDLLILDIYMPKQDGLETLYAIRKEKHALDVIVVSAAEDVDTAHRALQYGAVDYILKPFKFQRMKQALDNYRKFDRLKSKGSVTQEELDQMFYPGEKNRNEELPKGLNALTLKQVMDHLRQHRKPFSAEEVAKAVGIARVTARRYLEYLESIHQVRLEIQYGGVGRPVNRYIIVDQNEQK
ncbi:MAG: response regulator [Bacillaceae bacterium]|nr:response regulator [Bacillaceae bacterium]